MAAKSHEEVELPKIESMEGTERDGSRGFRGCFINDFLEAIQSRASDIHIESQSKGLIIRYRIDGILHLQPIHRKSIDFTAITSRLKIMARLNIAEKRLPQDGRIVESTRSRCGYSTQCDTDDSW